MNHFESSVINLIWTKKLVLLYLDVYDQSKTRDKFSNLELCVVLG